MEPELFYSLSQMPFMKATRLKSLYETEDFRSIQERLQYLIDNKGIGVFTGNPGTGKTSAIRSFAEKLNTSLYKVIYIQMTSISATEFFRQIAYSLGLDPGFRKSDIFAQVQEEITYLSKEKRCTPVIIVDEAQYLKQEIFRDLVMLLNFEMDSKDHCALILSGLSALNGLLGKSINEALRQRIIINYHAIGLSKEELRPYVQFVLDACGTRENIFSANALEAAYSNSQGSLRKLNRILSLSLIQGASTEERPISAETIRLACRDMDLS